MPDWNEGWFAKPKDWVRFPASAPEWECGATASIPGSNPDDQGSNPCTPATIFREYNPAMSCDKIDWTLEQLSTITEMLQKRFQASPETFSAAGVREDEEKEVFICNKDVPQKIYVKTDKHKPYFIWLSINGTHGFVEKPSFWHRNAYKRYMTNWKTLRAICDEVNRPHHRGDAAIYEAFPELSDKLLE